MFNGPPQWDHMYGHATPLAEKLMGPSSKAKESTQFENTTRCQWVISQGKHAIQNANCGIQQIPYWVQCGIKLCQFPWTPGRTFKLPKITNNGIWDWNGENHTRNIWLSSIIWYIIYTNDYKYIYIYLSLSLSHHYVTLLGLCCCESHPLDFGASWEFTFTCCVSAAAKRRSAALHDTLLLSLDQPVEASAWDVSRSGTDEKVSVRPCAFLCGLSTTIQ